MPDTKLTIESEGTTTLVAATATNITGSNGQQGIVQVFNNTTGIVYLVHAKTDGTVGSALSSTAGTYMFTLSSGDSGEYQYSKGAAIFAYSAAGGDLLVVKNVQVTLS